MALTPKQYLFVLEYIKDFNATQAAIRAGYAENSASAQGSYLLSNPKLNAAVTEAMAGRLERSKADADWLLNRLIDEAEADASDLYDDDGNILPVKEWPKIWRQGLVAGMEVEELFEGRGADRVQIGVVKKIKISDRVKRLEMIGKHIDVEAFKERLEHTGPGGGPVQTVDVGKLSTEALREIMGAKNETPEVE